jgi:hypothetical protein
MQASRAEFFLPLSFQLCFISSMLPYEHGIGITVTITPSSIGDLDLLCPVMKISTIGDDPTFHQ